MAAYADDNSQAAVTLGFDECAPASALDDQPRKLMENTTKMNKGGESDFRSRGLR